MLRPGRLAGIQASQVEVGRIRLGTSTPKTARSGKTYNEPVKLSRFRLTSRSEQLIRQAAQQYGGEVQQWTPQTGGAPQWEVIIESTSIAVIVPPNACSQYYEQWSGGKCTRRCDGATELLAMQQCPCGPEPAAKKAAGCKPTTRLSLMLAELPGIGIWRLESHGFYAAAELPAVADLLSQAGGNVPARLELEERSALVPDPRNPDKQVTARYMVPVLHVGATPAQIVGTFGQPAIAAGQQPTALPSAPEPVRTQAQVGTQPNALVAAVQREIAAEPDQGTLKQQWEMHTWYEDKINAAALTAQERDGWTAKVRAQTKLLPQFRDNLLAIIQHRWGNTPDGYPAADVTGVPFGTPTDPPPPPAAVAPQPAGEGATRDIWDDELVIYQDTEVGTPPAAAAAPVDRAAAWYQVNTAAGARGWGASRIKAEYTRFSGGQDVTAATGEQLQQFHAWMGQQA